MKAEPGHLFICHQIDWEESARAARACVRPHVDDDLDKLKHIYHGIDTVLVRFFMRIHHMLLRVWRIPSLKLLRQFQQLYHKGMPAF